MFSLAEVCLGALGAMIGRYDWTVLIWVGGTVPLLIALLLLRLVPGMASVEPDSRSGADPHASGGWQEMLSKRWRRYTLACIVMAGCNFTGYQLFSEFVTLYLKSVRHFPDADVGIAFSLIGAGSLVGGFFWAWISDRFGRKVPSIGFVGTALTILAFLFAPQNGVLIKTLGLLYGFCLSCTYPWGVWFTEIFPTRLRPHAAALLHAGHIISLLAPLVVVVIARQYGVAGAMAVAPAMFAIGTCLWLSLPETISGMQGSPSGAPQV